MIPIGGIAISSGFSRATGVGYRANYREIKWGCAARIKEGRSVCDSHHVREDVLEKTYTAAIQQITESADEVTAAVREGAMLTLEPENRERLEAVEQAIIETQEQALALLKKKSAHQITDAEYTDAIQTCSQRMKELEAQQAELQTIATRYSEVKEWLDTFEENVRSGDIMDANDAMVMKALVDEIIVGDTGIEIHCKCGITIEQEYVR